MEKVATYLTNFVIRYGKVSNQDREIYEYGLQNFLETILSLFICAILAQQMGMLVEGIIFFVIFIPLRSYAGGFHFDKYILCLLCSCATFLGVLYIVKIIIIISWIMPLLITVLLISIRILYPVEHIRRPIDAEEKKYFKKKLNLYLELDLAFSIVLFIFKKDKILSIVLLTLALIVVTMAIGKISYYRIIRKM